MGSILVMTIAALTAMATDVAVTLMMGLAATGIMATLIVLGTAALLTTVANRRKPPFAAVSRQSPKSQSNWCPA